MYAVAIIMIFCRVSATMQKTCKSVIVLFRLTLLYYYFKIFSVLETSNCHPSIKSNICLTFKLGETLTSNFVNAAIIWLSSEKFKVKSSTQNFTVVDKSTLNVKNRNIRRPKILPVQESSEYQWTKYETYYVDYLIGTLRVEVLLNVRLMITYGVLSEKWNIAAYCARETCQATNTSSKRLNVYRADRKELFCMLY